MHISTVVIFFLKDYIVIISVYIFGKSFLLPL